MTEKTRNVATLRKVEAFKAAKSLHPLVVGHMCKQDKTRSTFSKRYFALYDGGLLVYYTHERDYEEDVKKNKGLPLHCTLIKLDGLHLMWPNGLQHDIKHSFILHAPETSNHRKEFLLVCRTKKDMRIWVEQLQSQNAELAPGGESRKTPPYIQRLRLQCSSTTTQQPASIDELVSNWLKKQANYHPGDVALKFHTLNQNTVTGKPELKSV